MSPDINRQEKSTWYKLYELYNSFAPSFSGIVFATLVLTGCGDPSGDKSNHTSTEDQQFTCDKNQTHIVGNPNVIVNGEMGERIDMCSWQDEYGNLFWFVNPRDDQRINN